MNGLQPKLPNIFFENQINSQWWANENSVVAILPPPPPTNWPFSFSNLLFKENFSERQHCLGNCFLGSRNAGNGVSEYSILKISWGSMPPDRPRCLRLRRSRGALRCQENIHVRCFQKYVRYYIKQLKTLKMMKIICKPAELNWDLCIHPSFTLYTCKMTDRFYRYSIFFSFF